MKRRGKVDYCIDALSRKNPKSMNPASQPFIAFRTNRIHGPLDFNNYVHGDEVESWYIYLNSERKREKEGKK